MLKGFCSIVFCLFMVNNAFSQVSQTAEEELTKNQLISASQSGANPVFFNINNPDATLVSPGSVKYEGEYFIRKGIPNFLYKAKNRKPLRIGYIGGSITRAELQYRAQTAKYIQSIFPKVEMLGLNAGISGTGSDLGASRVQEQLLKYKPDLIFIEFAVNGGFAQGVEGIIRQIIKSNSSTDICLLYTISTGQSEIYASNRVPENIKALERIAEHYRLPTIHMGLSVGMLQKKDLVVWKGDPEIENKKIVFSKDGLHPLVSGGNLYAAAVARAFEEMSGKKVKNLDPHILPQALLLDNWEDAKMIDPKDFIKFSPGWKEIDPSQFNTLKAYSPWFDYLMKAENAGDSFSFSFEGDYFGIFDIGGPEVGMLEIKIDETNVEDMPDSLLNLTTNRFNKFCNNRFRGQYVFFKLPHGRHTITFKISSEIPDKKKILGPNQLEDITKYPEKYNRAAIYLGKLLIKGTPLKLE